MIRCDKKWQGVIRYDIRCDLIKCDTNFGHGNNLKVANKILWDLHLILKLTGWNPKKLQSENVYVL